MAAGAVTETVPWVVQGRPFDNAYCVLSLFEREQGVRVTAYNSETLYEAELLIPWETVSASVGHVNSRTPMEVGGAVCTGPASPPSHSAPASRVPNSANAPHLTRY